METSHLFGVEVLRIKKLREREGERKYKEEIRK